MKPLILPILAFVTFFALGGGAGAYVMRPAAADSTMVDSTHADSANAAPGHEADSTSGAGSTTLPHAVDTTSDASAAAMDAHAADPTRAPSTGASVPPTDPAVQHTSTPGGAATSAPTNPPNGTTPSSGAATGKAPAGQLTIQSLLRAQTGATVSMRPDGTIHADRPDSLPDYARMARLLSRMGPREAARTIERLSGTEAARALGAMSDKQAALVLSQLTPEKAASLLQATLALLPKTVAP